MKKRMIGLALIGSAGLIFSQTGLAQTQTVGLGYAHMGLDNEADLNGVHLHYRNEIDPDWGLIGSFTWATGKITSDPSRSADVSYYSLMMGPSYRFNDWFSLYGMLGFDYVSVKGKTEDYNKGQRIHVSGNSTGPAWGLGMIFNPTDSVAVNVGYEMGYDRTNADFYSSRGFNGFNVSLGYRF